MGKRKIIRLTESDIERIVSRILSENQMDEGWLRKTKEDKVALGLLDRVKEEFPNNAEYSSDNWGYSYIKFNMDGLRSRVRVILTEYSSAFGTNYSMEVNDRQLQASRWAIKKIWRYMYKIIDKRDREDDTRNIEADLIDPDFAQDVFDDLNDQPPVDL